MPSPDLLSQTLYWWGLESCNLIKLLDNVYTAESGLEVPFHSSANYRTCGLRDSQCPGAFKFLVLVVASLC